MVQGRGSWTSVGKDNGSIYYEYIIFKPLDGSDPSKDANYQAVNYTVKSIQGWVNHIGASWATLAGAGPLVSDGHYGPKTADKVKYAQERLGVDVDGQVGPLTSKALWLPVVQAVEHKNNIPGNYLQGLIRWESNWDPGAVGFVTNEDHGLVQINAQYHPEVKVVDAFDPYFAIDWAGTYLANSFKKYKKWEPTIASYNSPKYAKQWVESGKAPNVDIAKYVDNIMHHPQ